MSKTTTILLIVAAVSLMILAGVYYIFGSPTDSSVSTISNSTVVSSDEATTNKVANQETATTNSSANVADNSADIDKVVDSFVLDQNQESADFDSETADKSQIKIDSTDLLNLSQSYETNDF